jgi:hypothetical protein
MRGKLWFIGGLAAGFVLGARAGREKYEELVVKGRQVLDHPTVQEAAGVAQAQANRLYAEGKDRLSHTRLGEKLSTEQTKTTTELGSTENSFAGAGSASKGTSAKGTSTTTSAKTPGTGANGTAF